MFLVACVACKQREPPAQQARQIETPQEYWNAPATISRLEWLRINIETETVTDHGNCPDDEFVGPKFPACVSYYYVFDKSVGSVDLHLTVYNDAPARYLETYKKAATNKIVRKSKELYGRALPVEVSVDFYPPRK